GWCGRGPRGRPGRAPGRACAAGGSRAVLAASRGAWARARPPADALGLGLLAAFFAAPYALGYALAVLVVPLVLLLPRLSPRAAAWSLAVASVGPYLHLSAVAAGRLAGAVLSSPLR